MRFTIDQLLGRYLSIRARSVQEVRRYLQQKAKKHDISEDEQERLIQKYSEYGYISDEKFAESISHSLVNSKSKGRRFVQMKLQQAGIEKELVSQTLASIDPQETKAAMEKRLRRYEQRWQSLTTRERHTKAYSALLQAGFSSSEIRPFLDEWAIKE